MSPKTVLVHLDGRAGATETLKLGCQVARRFDAHLAAVFAVQPALLPAAADPAAGMLLEYLIEAESAMRNDARSQVAAAEAEHGIAIEWREAGRDVIGDIALQARHADLLVMSQEDPHMASAMRPAIPAGVILAAGRPVLLAPHAGAIASCGERVLLAWNGGREAARAAADALPFLTMAREVTVASFNPRSGRNWGAVPGADIGLWLARHNIRVTVRERVAPDEDVPAEMLLLAGELAIDLVVMGAYGHSRAHEMILGGVTRTMLSRMTAPTLMSH